MSECCLLFFRKLPFETNNKKFGHRRVKSKKIRGHPGGNLFQSSLEVGDTVGPTESSCEGEDGKSKKIEYLYHLRKGGGLVLHKARR